MGSNSIDSWLHGMPAEVKEALSREIDTKDNPSYGELSIDEGTVEIDLIANEWAKLAPWNEPGLSNSVNVAGTDELIIEVTGVYMVVMTLSYEVDTLGRYEVAVFVNDAIKHNLHISRDLNPNKLGAIALVGFAQLSIGDILDVRIKATAIAKATPNHASLAVMGMHQP